jgi:plastocyanin
MLLVRDIAVLVAAVALAGCGGGERAASATGRHARIELDDFLIRPQVLTARAGRLTLEVSNRGRLAHAFHLQQPGHDALKLAPLLPGDSATRSVVLAPGEYRMVCTVSNHAELGMTGRLVVR